MRLSKNKMRFVILVPLHTVNRVTHRRRSWTTRRHHDVDVVVDGDGVRANRCCRHRGVQTTWERDDIVIVVVAQNAGGERETRPRRRRIHGSAADGDEDDLRDPTFERVHRVRRGIEITTRWGALKVRRVPSRFRRAPAVDDV